MSKYFYRFMVIVLLTFVGVGILGSGQVFASGGSFNVPQVNDHFEKVQKGPEPTKETPITPTSSKNTKPGLWDRFTTTCKNLWNKAKQTAVHAWHKTWDFCSKHKWLAGVLFWMTVITIAASLFKGQWDAVVDTVKGIIYMVRHPIKTAAGIIDALSHPVQTGKAIWKTISDSWERDVVHGNAKSRAHWLGYAIIQVASIFVGTKGVDKISDASAISKISQAAKMSKIGRAARISEGLNRVQEGLRKLHIPQTVSKVRSGLSTLRQMILGNKVAASVITVVSITTGLLALDPEAVIQAFNKITVATEKFEVKTAFKNAEKCFGYHPTPKYFASVNEPFFKCFYSPDGRDGGEGSLSSKHKSNDLRNNPFRNLEGQISYGDSDLSKMVQNYRKEKKLFSGRNVAVFEYLDDGQYKYIIKESGNGHSERKIARELEEEGIQPNQVTRIYSELEPCVIPGGMCKPFIEKTFPQAKVTYSFEYGDTKESRRKGVSELKKAVRQLKNE